MSSYIVNLSRSVTTLHNLGIVSRDLHSEILHQALAAHPTAFRIWCVWEPNAFDNHDADFRDQSAHDSTGRFIPAWYRNGDSLTLTAVNGYESQGRGDWYWIPKKSGEICATDPYRIRVDGAAHIVTSELAPILKAGRSLGVMGLDSLAALPPGERLPARAHPSVRILSANEQNSGLRRLTRREREVHYWLCQGKSNEDIAQILTVSPHTVKNHIDHIFQKLGVENRYAAALLHPSRTGA